jgi:hypothetical protein
MCLVAKHIVIVKLQKPLEAMLCQMLERLNMEIVQHGIVPHLLLESTLQ